MKNSDVSEPYRAGHIPDYWKYGKIKDVKGRMVAISGLRTLQRKVSLIYPKTRSVSRYEIVEISATSEMDAVPGKSISDILCIGFFEVEDGGQVIVSEPIFIGEKYIGEIAGFSEVHYPNHMHVIVKSDKWFKEQLNKPPLCSWPSGPCVYDIGLDVNYSVIITQKT